jgi:predicted N-acetyltransferase YhbS
MSVRIRDEAPADGPAIEALTIRAFSNAPHTSHTEQHIVNALRASGRLTVSLVAELDRTLIGHVAISPVVISDGSPGWFGLGPLSVLPEHQRRGVGSQLAREALRLLRERGTSGCVVLGEPEYYGRFGFRVDPGLVLPGVSREYFQVLTFGASRPAGIVAYDAAFNA